jgi:hypothetical protein
MTKDEALKLALEALEQLQGGCTDHDDGTVEAITVWCPEVIDAIKEALAQPDAFEQGRQEGMKQERALWTLTKLGQEIEAQEPVAWMFLDDLKSFETTDAYANAYSIEMVIPTQSEAVWLYTTPQERPWVGLTQEEEMLIATTPNKTRHWVVCATEAKLKEKNA